MSFIKADQLIIAHVPGPVAQYIAEGEYNAERTARMALVHFRMLNNKLLNKDPDVVP